MSKSTQEAIKQLRDYKVTCPNCKKESPLSLWGFVQTYWYERPRGCMDGDNWWPSEDIKQCLLVCPNTCLSGGVNFAVRIYDLPIDRRELDWVFGLVKQITKLHESDLSLIFADHYVQYGDREIENSEERRRAREAELEIY